MPELSEVELDGIMFDYIRPAAVKFRACWQDLSDRDDLANVFNITLADDEIEILTALMLIEYLTANYINVPSLLRQSLTSKDFQVFSSRNHLDGLVNLREVYKQEARQLMSAYSNPGAGLFETLKGGG